MDKFLNAAWLLWLSLFLAHSAWGQDRRPFDVYLEDLDISGNPDYFADIRSEVMVDDDIDDLVANVNFRIRQDLSDQCDVHILGYQSDDGVDWLEVYARDDNLCDYVATNQCIFKNIGQYGNFPRQCPFTPTDIQIKKYRPDPNCFPKGLRKTLLRAGIIISCKSPNGTDVEALRISTQVKIL
ncbi:hypothetical protein BDV32DRAFT_143766 [Aspergillus pseudonomiae]|uniref:Uncharacterized protein n=1 Tax=Aspergillus pseudonomiae TaxID=1506151 RepID=A0A5N6IH18_9EURO|nr:uncharacterized protein BDV37DRAFT_278412 [Aspergillus pseudonomiae]KAB8266032.1 hypothetical protein BDV32DRAFT_143766 [Aspergillus pseudonomiae]KAE8408898.1 hypothetical protein BDV37DRAFT_278412 [Aspergillus pseudonomiae]